MCSGASSDAGASICKYGSWLYVYEIHSFIHVYAHKCIYASTRTGAEYVFITSGNMNNYNSGGGSYSNDANGNNHINSNCTSMKGTSSNSSFVFALC